MKTALGLPACLLLSVICGHARAQFRPAEDPSAAPDWQSARWPACEGMLLPDVSGMVPRLLAESDLPADARMSVLEIELRSGPGYRVSFLPQRPWQGFELPRDALGAEGRPWRLRLRRAGEGVQLSADGQPCTLAELGGLLAGAERAVIVEPAPDVAWGFVVSLSGCLLDLGVVPRFARAEEPADSQPAPVFASAMLEASRRAEVDADGLPRLGLRVRADARCAWWEVARLLELCAQQRVFRITFAARAGGLELDLFLPRAFDAEPPAGGRQLAISQPLEELAPPGESVPPLAPDRAPLTGVGGIYSPRFEPRQHVPEPQAAAVEAALDWLARHQRAETDGSGAWQARDWSAQCQEKACRGPCLAEPDGVGPGRGASHYDVGVTGLALLAFLGHGTTPERGRHPHTVLAGLRWLLAQQDRDTGSIGYNPARGESIYNHALATLALAEACALWEDAVVRAATRRALDFCLQAQNPGSGWRYGVRTGKNDTSLTAWMLSALEAGRLAGFELPDEAFAGGLAWLQRVTASDGQAGYLNPGGGSAFLRAVRESVPGEMYRQLPTMTGAALVGRLACGQSRDGKWIQKGAWHLLAELPAWDGKGYQGVNFYYWQLASQALFQVGGDSWTTWGLALRMALLPTQRQEGCAAGSWDPLGEWAFVGGRVYSTAMGALCLQTPYRRTRRED